MKSKLYSAILISLIVTAVSCRTARKMYEKGHYDEAVELAAKKLQKDPNDTKLLDIIRSSYRYAVEDHQASIRRNGESSNELRWEWMYNDYAAMQRMYDAIRKVPAVNDIVNPVDYGSALVTYGEKAGDVRFDRGLSLLSRGDKMSARSAYDEIRSALYFKPGNRDFEGKLQEALEMGTTNVVILPMEQRNYRFASYNSNQYSNFDETLLRNLQNNSGSRFVRFYDPIDAQNRNIHADQVLDMRFATMDIGRTRDEKTSRTVTKDVVIKEIVYRPDSVVKVYGKVSATLTTTKRTMRSTGIMKVSVRDDQGRWIWNEDFTGNHFWSTEFTTFTGDERALDANDKQLINRRPEMAPRDEEVIRCIMNELDNNVQCRLRDYFSRV